ncbi:DUF4148 domain-containing protein [Burkholderia diffusa]|uniref:DUF4148 domain-containing protein n=1 Tax=Burkholderia diffusa TaxID=488732 RepID=UPI001FD61C79|nr:DUF4148 domain-containing protein [Burkholderia diffusa]
MIAHRRRINLGTHVTHSGQGANFMNMRRPLISIAIATLSIAAFSQSATAQSRTRQEVRQELLRARHDGVIPSPKHDYPPSPATIARNQEIHRSTVHRGESAPVVDAHDDSFEVR